MNVLLMLCIEHWIISSILIGVLGVAGATLMHNTILTESGKIISVVMYYLFIALLLFGGLCGVLATLKYLWSIV